MWNDDQYVPACACLFSLKPFTWRYSNVENVEETIKLLLLLLLWRMAMIGDETSQLIIEKVVKKRLFHHTTAPTDRPTAQQTDCMVEEWRIRPNSVNALPPYYSPSFFRPLKIKWSNRGNQINVSNEVNELKQSLLIWWLKRRDWAWASFVSIYYW